MSRKLSPKLEGILDEYAMFSFFCDIDNPNKQVITLLRRYFKQKKKKRKEAIKYYRQQRLICQKVIEGLDQFAKSYGELEDEGSRLAHDMSAMEFITGVFGEDRYNSMYFIFYYDNQKEKNKNS